MAVSGSGSRIVFWRCIFISNHLFHGAMMSTSMAISCLSRMSPGYLMAVEWTHGNDETYAGRSSPLVGSKIYGSKRIWQWRTLNFATHVVFLAFLSWKVPFPQSGKVRFQLCNSLVIPPLPLTIQLSTDNKREANHLASMFFRVLSAR